MAVDTLFQPQGGAGSNSSGDYVKDHFLDTSRAAANNSGLTSSASTNPLSFSFNDTDSAFFGTKTLFIKDAVLVEDRSKWISNKPTYEITFTEYVPNFRAYACGNIRVRNSTRGKIIDVRSIGDIFGVTGLITQLGWLVSPSDQATATATTVTDGSNVSTINFANASSDSYNQGIGKYNIYLHNSSASTYDIHDYRLAALQAGLLSVEGVVVFNSATNVVCRPGSTYNDKTLITTSTGATLTPYGVTGSIGAKTVIYKAGTGVYTQTTQEPNSLVSVATGSSGTNLMTVTTGHGASFGLGYGIVTTNAGSSQYFGIVTNISTDTLTVGPTLPFGVSGALYKYFAAGSTYAISSSLYKIKNSLDFYELNNQFQTTVFGATLSGNIAYNDPQFNYNVRGKDLNLTSVDGYLGVGFFGNTLGFLQVDGNFAAADLEISAAGIFNGTFAINGAPAWGINAGATGNIRYTVFTDGGPGWNSFTFTPGQSFVNAVITKINLYELTPPRGATAGLLAEYPTMVSRVNRGGVENASLMELGSLQRIYADQLYLTGEWTRGVSTAFPGNIAYFGASANCVMNFQYFGKNFALLGTEGGSMTLTLDGASIGSAFNSLKSVASMSWHTLALTYKAGATCVLSGVSFEKPEQTEIISKQEKEPRQDLKRIPETFVQSNTPQMSKDGDSWIQTRRTISLSPQLWFKAAGLWNLLSVANSTDDPLMESYYRFGGSTANSNATATADGESFNQVSWGAMPSTPAIRVGAAASNAAWSGSVYQLSGLDASTTAQQTAYQFNKASWSTITVLGANQVYGAAIGAFGGIWMNKGTTTDAAAQGTAVAKKSSGAAWTTMTAWAIAQMYNSNFFVNNLICSVGGLNTAGSANNTHDTRNSADSLSTNTALPVTGFSRYSSNSSQQIGVICRTNNASDSTTSYAWNGSAWTAALATVTSLYGGNGGGPGFFAQALIAFLNGGSTLAGAVSSASEVFNNISFSASTSSATARSTSSSGVA